MKNVLVTMLAVVVLCGAANGAIFSDDFSAYAVDATATAPDMGNNWFPSSDPLPVSNESRIFQTGLYDDGNLWISLVDGTSITSRGIDVDANTDLTFLTALVAETSTDTRAVESTYDLLLGTDAGSATSLIGGPVTVIAHSDGFYGTSDSYADQTTTQAFNTGAVGAGEQLFIKITRVGAAEGYDNAFFGVGFAEVVPEPATMAILGLGGLLLRRRRA